MLCDKAAVYLFKGNIAVLIKRLRNLVQPAHVRIITLRHAGS